MVLAERNSDNVRNGRRSRGPSPNGHASESSSEEEGGKYNISKLRKLKFSLTLLRMSLPDFSWSCLFNLLYCVTCYKY